MRKSPLPARTDSCQTVNGDRLRFVFPKQSRLYDAFNAVTAHAGLKLEREKKRHAFGICYDHNGQMPDFEATIKKPGVMFRKLDEARVDMAVIGLDKFIEERCRAEANGIGLNARITASFNCASCGMFIAAAPETEISQPEDLSGMRIATSYPYSLRAWLADKGIKNFEIIICDGDTEDEIRDGSADAIFEIVDSGTSLRDNDLVPKIPAYDVQAVLIERKGEWSAHKTALAGQLRKRLCESAATLYGDQDTKIAADNKNADYKESRCTSLVLPAARHLPR